MTAPDDQLCRDGDVRGYSPPAQGAGDLRSRVRPGHQTGYSISAEDVIAKLDRMCCAVVDGRRATQALARWALACGLGESDLHMLWTLWRAAPERLNQSTLACRLAISPAQVSSTVERLRAKSWIERSPDSADRRRNLCHLTAEGQQVLGRFLAEAQKSRISDFGLRIELEFIPEQACHSERSEESAGQEILRCVQDDFPGGFSANPQSAIRNPQFEEDAA